MRTILSTLFDYKRLTKEESKSILLKIAKGNFSQPEIAAFLTVFNMRAVSLDELRGFREALLELALTVDLSDFNTIDLCGTGGDGKDTFNISTLSAFVVAGAGGSVAKHGNYSASSSCGSSNVIEHLGYKFSNDPEKLKRELDRVGITVLHAPLFNPAMKSVAPVRGALGVKTFFNMLGPMVNPSSPQNQLVGVFSLELARMYGYMYQQTDRNYSIVHSLDGYDEVSLTGKFKVIDNRSERIMSPSDLGLKSVKAEQLASASDVKGSAAIFMKLLNGEGTEAQNSAVIANSALAINCLEPSLQVDECVERARKSLLDGEALAKFSKLISIQ